MDSKVKYLTEKQTSNLTGFALSTLRNHRHLNRGLPYIKAGKSIRYSFNDVIDFMDSHKVVTEN